MQTNPVKAIREKCLDCSCGQIKEIRLCPVTNCALYPFRFGKNPYRIQRKLTEKQKQALFTGREINKKVPENIQGKGEKKEG